MKQPNLEFTSANLTKLLNANIPTIFENLKQIEQKHKINKES